MKKFYTIPLIVFLCGFLSVQAFASVQKILTAEESNAQIYINGEKKDFKNAPVTINGTTYVPLRELEENMKTDVVWKNSEKRISLYTVPLQKRIDTFFPYLYIEKNDSIHVQNIDYKSGYMNNCPYTEVTAVLDVDKAYFNSGEQFFKKGNYEEKQIKSNDLLAQEICSDNNIDVSKAIERYHFMPHENGGDSFVDMYIDGNTINSDKIRVVVYTIVSNIIKFDK